MISEQDRQILRPLASRWMELAQLPIMQERKRQWTALKDLHAERPMIQVETCFIQDYVADSELQCADPFYRDLEKQLRWKLRHMEEVGDDSVIDPFLCIGWDMDCGNYGVSLAANHAQDSSGGSIAYSFDHPIRTPDDISKLRPRSFAVDRERTYQRKEKIAAAIGDLLPVVLHGTEGLHAALTQDLFKLVGMENMMLWLYDEPDAIHQITTFLRDDRKALFEWMEQEQLLGLNNGNQYVGSGSLGYTTALPQSDYAGKLRTKDLWVWMESQETVTISPNVFAEFFLPYMAELCAQFGLIYYGCCEPVHDRWVLIRDAIPNIRAVSISPWCDLQKMGEMLGRDYVFSRKLMPTFISGKQPDWEQLRDDVAKTLDAAKGCNLEFIFRDIYTVCGDRSRLGKWVEMVRGSTGTYNLLPCLTGSLKA